MKTLLAMQADFDKVIDDILNPDNDKIGRSMALENAESLAKIAKQKINALNLVQKADIMSGRHDRTDFIVGEINE